MKPGVHLIWRRLDGRHVFLADLLLDQSAANELIECLSPREFLLGRVVRIENGEANLVVEIAGQDDVPIDDGDSAVEDDGRGG